MTYERLFSGFSGRIGRWHFWIGAIMLALVEINYLLLMGFILDLSPVDFWIETRSTQLVMLSAFFLTLMPGMCLGFKRLHDRGISGWWLSVFYLFLFQIHLQPFYGRILRPFSFEWMTLNLPLFAGIILGVWLLIVMGFMPGHRGRNRFGDDPKVGLEMRSNV